MKYDHNTAELRNDGITLMEAGAALNVTRERCRQLEAKALKKLRVYAVSRLGREPRDFWEIVSLFQHAPDPDGVRDAWLVDHQSGPGRPKHGKKKAAETGSEDEDARTHAPATAETDAETLSQMAGRY